VRQPAEKNFVAIRKVAFTTAAKKTTLTARLDERFMSALPRTDDMPVGSSEFFCSNSRCTFHVRVGDKNVRGFGDWATLANGTTVSHRWIRGELFCDLCAPEALARPTRP